MRSSLKKLYIYMLSDFEYFIKLIYIYILVLLDRQNDLLRCKMPIFTAPVVIYFFGILYTALTSLYLPSFFSLSCSCFAPLSILLQKKKKRYEKTREKLKYFFGVKGYHFVTRCYRIGTSFIRKARGIFLQFVQRIWALIFHLNSKKYTGVRNICTLGLP